MPTLVLGTTETVAASSYTAGRLSLAGYTGYEKSLTSGSPEELYLFNENDANYWTYTSSNRDINYGGRTYLARLIRRGDISLHANSLKTQLEITTAITNAFGRQYISGPIEHRVSLTIYRRHSAESADWVTYWKGFVKAVGFKSKSIKIIATLNTLALSRYGLMVKYSRLCAVPLYSPRCTILKTDSDFYRDGTITTISGPYIDATIFGTVTNGWFSGGIFKTDNGVALQKIISHSSTRVKLSRAVEAIEVGDTFRAWFGCDHGRNDCRIRFDNELNYQGQPYIPDKNPMSGDPIM